MRLALVAAGTSQIEIGTAVYQVPLRHPVELAQRFMSLAAFSHNRFTAGVGSGSTDAGSFAPVGLAFDERYRSLNEGIDLLRRLLRGETVGDAELPPWPETEGGPHLVLGAWTNEAAIVRAATEYDGWMASAGRMRSGTVDGAAKGQLATMRESIKRYRDAGGRRAMLVSCAINLAGPDRPLGEGEGFNLLCGPAEARERLVRLSELGFDDVCCVYLDLPGTTPRDLTADDLEEMRSLIPRDDRRPYVEAGAPASLRRTRPL
jgi:alkanesulfonate monooxygenase SsuD/methylene tetrahydromethanopterin reductase-like flavin-dependent oxidoreductase (luciferase family)